MKLHFSTFQAHCDIYNQNSRWDKDKTVYAAVMEENSSFGMTSHKAAKQRREVVQPFYSRRNILKMQEAIDRQVWSPPSSHIPRTGTLTGSNADANSCGQINSRWGGWLSLRSVIGISLFGTRRHDGDLPGHIVQNAERTWLRVATDPCHG